MSRLSCCQLMHKRMTSTKSFCDRYTIARLFHCGENCGNLFCTGLVSVPIAAFNGFNRNSNILTLNNCEWFNKLQKAVHAVSVRHLKLVHPVLSAVNCRPNTSLRKESRHLVKNRSWFLNNGDHCLRLSAWSSLNRNVPFAIEKACYIRCVHVDQCTQTHERLAQDVLDFSEVSA